MKEIKFEDALKKLEKIVSDLEAGDMPLEDSLSRYEEGIKLSKICSRQLERAKSRVELLMKSGDSFELKPFGCKDDPGRGKQKHSKKEKNSKELF